ncbi:MAG: hypothetical protein ACRDBX_01350, partial [Erysipelotrichaceae bacterium]
MMGKVLALLGALMPLLSLRLWSTLWIHHFSENDLVRLGVEDPICFMEKRLRKACMVWVAMGAYIVVESNVYLLAVMSMGVLVYELPYLQLKNAHKQHLKALRFQFPICLRQFQILLESNNVSQSLL